MTGRGYHPGAAMTARFTIREISSDGHGLRLLGDVQGGSIIAGDHLEVLARHVRVLAVDAPRDDGQLAILVDPTCAMLLETNAVLERVDGRRAAGGDVLSIPGMPPGVDRVEHDEPGRAPLDDPDEPAGSGPGYDTLK
jgi:hypothetical protein